jgi:hypothetical protein
VVIDSWVSAVGIETDLCRRSMSAHEKEWETMTQKKMGGDIFKNAPWDSMERRSGVGHDKYLIE